MSITENELRINLDKYLVLAETEDIYITKNGREIAKLSKPEKLTLDEINAEIACVRYGDNSGIAAMEKSWLEAEKNGTADMPLNEIDAEIAAVRSEGRQAE